MCTSVHESRLHLSRFPSGWYQSSQCQSGPCAVVTQQSALVWAGRGQGGAPHLKRFSPSAEVSY